MDGYQEIFTAVAAARGEQYARVCVTMVTARETLHKLMDLANIDDEEAEAIHEVMAPLFAALAKSENVRPSDKDFIVLEAATEKMLED